MHLSTPPRGRLRPSSSSSSSSESASPYTPTNPSRRAFAPRPSHLGQHSTTATSWSSSDGNTPSNNVTPAKRLLPRGTPVNQLLARERVQSNSPRRIRQRTWKQRAQDWPTNLVMSIETSIQLWSFDSCAYPTSIALHVIHLMTRLPVLTAALPAWIRFSSFTSSSSSSTSRFYATAQQLADADARLAALKRQTAQSSTWSWFTAGLSIALIVLSFANAAYLFSRRRKYQLVLRKDPLASPSARTGHLEFSSSTDTITLFQRLRKHVVNRFKTPKEKPSHQRQFQVQELDIWTPDYVLWSLRIFTLYPPPVAVMYHLLTPSSFLPFVLIGSLVIGLFTTTVKLYSTLLNDRALLQAEVMHEYNAKFVNPRIFVSKRDQSTSTSDLEFAEWKHAMMINNDDQVEDERGTRSSVAMPMTTEGELGYDDLDKLVRGSGRKSIGGRHRKR
ncbi:hypothetical protein OIO90_000156 [Microbotryomycetes sp. JL221]|nr:hypothetical protein OIO90_000156 [Microbotryomycetes sp. JL221]